MNRPEPERRRLVERAWQEPLPRLLVFDNVDDEAAIKLLKKWRPTHGGCRVLVTSRRGGWPSSLDMVNVPLAPLPEAESATLLSKLAVRLSHAEAQQIATVVGNFPLALYLAGSYLQATPYRKVAQSLNDFELQKLNHQAMQGKRTEDSPTDHDLSVAGTFALSWQRLDPEHDRLAIWLMQHAACFAPNEAIPDKLLQKGLERRDEWVDTTSKDDVLDAVTRLEQLGLLTKETAFVQIHSLVAAFVWHDVQTEQERVFMAVESGLISEAYRLNLAGYPAAIRQWLTHFYFVTERALIRGDEQSSALSMNLGYHLVQDGNYDDALPLYERSLGIREEVLGERHPSTATSLNNLALLYESKGEYEKALPLYEAALPIVEDRLGHQHPTTNIVRQNLEGLRQKLTKKQSRWRRLFRWLMKIIRRLTPRGW